MSGNEFFYKDKDGKKQDASLHEPILAAGDEEAVRTTTILRAVTLGLRLVSASACPDRPGLLQLDPRRQMLNDLRKRNRNSCARLRAGQTPTLQQYRYSPRLRSFIV
jgi:hypothetical protein